MTFKTHTVLSEHYIKMKKILYLSISLLDLILKGYTHTTNRA